MKRVIAALIVFVAALGAVVACQPPFTGLCPDPARPNVITNIESFECWPDKPTTTESVTSTTTTSPVTPTTGTSSSTTEPEPTVPTTVPTVPTVSLIPPVSIVNEERELRDHTTPPADPYYLQDPAVPVKVTG